MKKHLRFGKNLICALVFILSFYITTPHGYSQGCVAVRHVSTTFGTGANSSLSSNQWQISAGYRYFHSYKHFRGAHEETDRVKNHTEVINNSHSLDLTLSYAFSKRLTINFTLPINYNDRSSLYEHDRVTRHHTQSSGIGDVRLTGSYWLLDPEKSLNQNLAIGFGLKAPTGDYNVKDQFYTKDGVVTRPVDQSIQLGDGGLGIILDLQGYKKVLPHTFAYFNAFYLINPRNTNGTRTQSKDSVEIKVIRSVMSTPDQYMIRAGLSYSFPQIQGLSAGGGLRYEGVTVWDLIGGSDGFRRPGRILSFEPVVNYMRGKNIFSLNLPVALYRERPKSVADIRTNGKGGDAAFADGLIFVNYARRF